MPVRPVLLRLVAAALLAPAVAMAAEEPAPKSAAATPAPPMGVLNSSDRLPIQAPQTESRPPARRLSPSEIYARDHAARRPPSALPPSFATVRPQMRKPLPGEGPDNPAPEKAAASKLPVAPAPKAASKAANTEASPLDGLLADKPAPKAPAAKTKTVKKTTTTTTATVLPPVAPSMPEIIVRPATPAAIYERAAMQYRALRRRDLDLVRHLLPQQQYEDKLAAIEASYTTYQQ